MTRNHTGIPQSPQPKGRGKLNGGCTNLPTSNTGHAIGSAKKQDKGNTLQLSLVHPAPGAVDQGTSNMLHVVSGSV